MNAAIPRRRPCLRKTSRGAHKKTVTYQGWRYSVMPECDHVQAPAALCQQQFPMQLPEGTSAVELTDPDFSSIKDHVIAAYSWSSIALGCLKNAESQEVVAYYTKGGSFKPAGELYTAPQPREVPMESSANPDPMKYWWETVSRIVFVCIAQKAALHKRRQQ